MITAIRIAESPVTGITEPSRVKTYRVKVNFERLETILAPIAIIATIIAIGTLQHIIG